MKTYTEIEKILREREDAGEFDNEYVSIEMILEAMRNVICSEGLDETDRVWETPLSPIEKQNHDAYDRAMRGI